MWMPLILKTLLEEKLRMWNLSIIPAARSGCLADVLASAHRPGKKGLHLKATREAQTGLWSYSTPHPHPHLPFTGGYVSRLLTPLLESCPACLRGCCQMSVTFTVGAKAGAESGLWTCPFPGCPFEVRGSMWCPCFSEMWTQPVSMKHRIIVPSDSSEY